MLSRSPSFMKSQKGFSLLEVMLAVGIALGIGALSLNELVRRNDSSQARAVGEEMRTVGNALNTYVALRHGPITQLTTVPDIGTADDPGPRICDGATRICRVTVDTLRRAGLLPPSFSGRNPFGAEYGLYIRVGGAAPSWIVDGFVVTTQAYTNGDGDPRYDLLGQAMQAAGADAGMTRSNAQRVEGLNGSWSESGFQGRDPNGNLAINRLGLLAYRTGYSTSGYAAFLRLDGTTPMVGDLQMGDNDILNAGTITANAAVRAGSQVSVRTPAANMIALGTDADGTLLPDGATLGVSGGTLNIRSASGVMIENPDGSGMAPLRAGDTTVSDLSATGSIDSVGSISSQTDVIAGNLVRGARLEATGAGVVAGTPSLSVVGSSNLTGDVTVDGDLGTTGNITSNGFVQAQTLRSTGNVIAAGFVQAGNAGFRIVDAVNPANTAGWMLSGNELRMLSSANVRDVRLSRDLIVPQSVFVGDGITANPRLVIRGDASVTAGALCTAPGSMAFASNIGQIVQCAVGGTGNRWIRLATSESTVEVHSGNAASMGNACGGARPQVDVACPAGWTRTGGGYALETYAPIVALDNQATRCVQQPLTSTNGQPSPGTYLQCQDDLNATAPAVSAPISPSSWRVSVNGQNGNSCFRAYVVCVR